VRRFIMGMKYGFPVNFATGSTHFPSLFAARDFRFHGWNNVSRVAPAFLMKKSRFRLLALAALLIPTVCGAWDYEGHRVVNLLALDSLPSDFPAFVKEAAARERIAFLSGEPDRWRNTPDANLKHANNLDHYLDFEDLEPYHIAPSALSAFRYEFTSQMAAARAANPSAFPAVDPARDLEKTRAFPGFLPWMIAEQYSKLKSGFSYLKVFEELGTPEEVANARQNIIYIMGVIGHFVGDGAQPLHTTKHFNGWVGLNPNGYTNSNRIHAWIDGGYIRKVGGADAAGLKARLRPAKLLWPEREQKRQEEVFPKIVEYLLDQFKLVEPLYKMEKEGKFSGEGAAAKEGKPFIEGQLLKGGQMLGDLYYSAWQQARPDVFLTRYLNERKLETK
jgi:hypothetical protein